MTATIHTLPISQRHPADLKSEGLLAHTCGSTSFRLTVAGNVYCAKCGALVEAVEVRERQPVTDAAA